MKPTVFWSVPAIIAIAVALLLTMPPQNANSNILGDLLSSPESNASEPIVIGNPDAPVVIEEYASLSCPHCASFHNDILPELMKTHIAIGKAKLLWHSYVRNEPDLRGTMLLQCIGDNERQVKFVKVLFKMQDRWAFEEDFQSALGDIARAGGVSEKEFNRCMADTELEIAILGVRKNLSDSGKVKSTPTFYIGGQEIVGARPAAEFAHMIDRQLAKSSPQQIQQQSPPEGNTGTANGADTTPASVTTIERKPINAGSQ